jgi:hypothetical protein
VPDLRISQLDAATAITADDLLVMVNDPSGAPTPQKITVSALFGSGAAIAHSITGASHTITGAQYSLVGATALDTLGLLTPSADVSAGATAILRSNAGALTLANLTLGGLTASTLIYSSAGKVITSLANSGVASYLRNDGAGALSWVTTATPTAHDIVSSHTYSGGAALDVFGLSAASTIAKLTPSSNPGAAASLLASNASGYLRLTRIGIGVDPSYPVDIQGTNSQATLGATLLTNGDFATGDLTGWTAGANWAYSGGGVQHTAGSVEAISQNISVTSGQYYIVDWSQTGATAGTLAFAIGAVSYTVNYSDTVKSVTIVPTSTGSLSFSITPSSAYNGTLDNIRVRVVSAINSPVMQLRDSDGTVRMEFRSGGVAGNGAFGGNGLSYIITSLDGIASTDNLAFGTNTLENCTTGYRNIGVGTQTLRRTTFGNSNTGIGYGVMLNNKAGSDNVGIGNQVLYNNLTGFGNVAIGTQALYTNQAGSLIVAIGYQAGYSLNPSAGNSSTVLVGWSAGYTLSTGDFNTLVGTGAGQNISTGAGNTCMGRLAGQGITGAGGNNTIVGAQAGSSVGTATGNVYLGYRAGFGETGSSTLMIDNINRASEAVGRLYALVYGLFASAPASQSLTVNGVLQAQIQSALTNTVQNLFILDHQTSGTAAAGFGGSLTFQLQSSTTAAQDAARLRSTWLVATHASRTVRLAMSAYDSGGERDGIYIDSDGTRALVGIGGTTPTARLHLPAGGTAANTAPLKFTTQASALTAVEQGTMELVGNSLQFTQLAKRRGVAMTRDTRTADFQLVSSAAESAAIITVEHSANYLEVGKTERIELWGTLQKDVGAPTNTLTIRTKYAGVTIHTIVSSNAAIAANTDIQIVIIATCRSVGGTGTLQVNSIVRIAGDVITPAAPTLTTIDTTTAQNTTVTAQFTNSSATNNLVIHQGYVLCVEPNK